MLHTTYMSYSEIKSFESRAKLMVSGEYLVLKGALSLALPLKFSQILTVATSEGKSIIDWESMIHDKIWFSAKLRLTDFQIIESNIPAISETLGNILMAARKLNPNFLREPQDLLVTSVMDFNPGWGIGSSSSLISNIAYWAACDPFELNRLIFNGSGYDIACTRSATPIIYEVTKDQSSCREANFHPLFHHQLYFVYLNRKQNSKDTIRRLDLSMVKTEQIDTISQLTLGLEQAPDLDTFQLLMERHEEIVGEIINKDPVKSSDFNDFDGSLKSLGAWGGDFILAASSASEEYVRNYFTDKGLTTFFKYNEIVLA